MASATRTAQVVVGKANDDAVGIMVAWAPVPTLIDVGGTQLDVAEGHAGADKDMTVTASANHRIDVSDKVVGRNETKGNGC